MQIKIDNACAYALVATTTTAEAAAAATWPSAEVSIIFHIHYYHIPKYDKLMHIYAFTLHQFVRRRFNAIPSSS